MYHAFTKFQMSVKKTLHQQVSIGTLNGTQFNVNKRKQLEFVNVTSTNQVVSV